MTQTQRTTKQRVSADAVIIGLIAGLALAYRAWLLSGGRIVWGDEPFYLWLAQNLAEGRGYTFFQGRPDVYLTPLFPFLNAGLYLLLGNLEWASNVCYLVFGSALVIPVYLLARNFYDHNSGILAALLVTFSPALAGAVLHWGTMTEPLYMFLVYSGVAAAFLGVRWGRLPLIALAGVALALAYLTRAEAIVWFVIVLAWLIFAWLWERRLFERQTLLCLLAFIVVFGLLILPYAIYLRLHTGRWMLSGQAGMTFITVIGLAYGDVAAFDRDTWGLNSNGDEVIFFSPEIVQFSVTRWARANPEQFVDLIKRNARDFLSTFFNRRMFPLWLALAVTIGWFRRIWDRRRLADEALLFGGFLPVLSFLFFFVQERYIAAALPVTFIWAAHGLSELGDWLAGTITQVVNKVRLAQPWRMALLFLPVVLVLVYFIVTQPGITAATSLGSFRPEHKEAGLWLREHLPSRTTVMARYPAIAFYAAGPWVPTPNAELEDVLRYARSHGARYWALDEGEARRLRPQLAFLFDASQPPPPLRVIHTAGEKGGRVFIFEIEGSS